MTRNFCADCVPDPGNSTFTREVADSILDTEPYKAVMSLSRCNVWNEVKEVWESNGCQVCTLHSPYPLSLTPNLLLFFQRTPSLQQNHAPAHRNHSGPPPPSGLLCG